MYNGKNGTLKIENDTMDYISIGKGEQILVVLPGLGDGLKTVKGMALLFAVMYHKLAGKYRVYFFSRRNRLPDPYSSKEMAKDVKLAMDMLGIQKAHVLGVSQGGTIAQYVALDYPERVEKLILAITYGKANETVKTVVNQWIAYAQKGDYPGLFVDMSEKIYCEKTLKRNRKLYWLLTRVGAPKHYDRFLIQAKACVTHDAYALLPQIKCPTLIIGGKQDKVVTAQASKELANRIAQSSLILYEEFGHGLYEEATDFWDRVTAFLENNEAKISCPVEM